MIFNVADLFESLATAIPEREALVCGDRRLTFVELDERANRLGHWFEKRGVKPGQHVGLYLYNGVEYLEAMLALFKIRAVPININYRYVADELRYMVENADLVGILHQREFAPLLSELRSEYPGLAVNLYVDDDSGADCEACGSTELEAAMAAGSARADFPPRSEEDLYIVYTGGTTGMPKGVMWRHGDVFFAGLQGGNPGGEPIERPEQLAQNARANPNAMVTLPVAPFIHGAAQ